MIDQMPTLLKCEVMLDFIDLTKFHNVFQETEKFEKKNDAKRRLCESDNKGKPMDDGATIKTNLVVGNINSTPHTTEVILIPDAELEPVDTDIVVTRKRRNASRRRTNSKNKKFIIGALPTDRHCINVNTGIV